MSKLRDKLNRLGHTRSTPTNTGTDRQIDQQIDRDTEPHDSKIRTGIGNTANIKKNWHTVNAQEGLSTREKLEKLVNLSLKNKKNKTKPTPPMPNPEDLPQDTPDTPDVPDTPDAPGTFYTLREYTYPFTSTFGKFQLGEWRHVSARQLAVIFSDNEDLDVSPGNLVFFDTETTGLAGGTGTIPFMLGFGYFGEDCFRVKIFILNDLSKEDQFLDEVDRFLASHCFSAVVTYNGKSFDFPLMETRYILQRKRFPLLKVPHLDFLFPARTLWKNTCESRKLGHLGDVLLGISREDDIDGSRIPALYFNYLRSKFFGVIQKVVEHNALDLVGLAALLLLAVKYQEDIAFAHDEGEILGTARLYEKYGDLTTATRLYTMLQQSGVKQEVLAQAVRGLAQLKKKEKLYREASGLWEAVCGITGDGEHRAMRELSVHFEHREKDYTKALDYVRRALENPHLTEAQRLDFEKRLDRLSKKIRRLEKASVES